MEENREQFQSKMAEAYAKLSLLSKADATEVRSFAYPPQKVRNLFLALTPLSDASELQWPAVANKFLNIQFVKDLAPMSLETFDIAKWKNVEANLKQYQLESAQTVRNLSRASYTILDWALVCVGAIQAAQACKGAHA